MKESKYFINENYLNYVGRIAPKTKEVRTLLRAFWVGGFICSIGQAFRLILENFA